MKILKNGEDDTEGGRLLRVHLEEAHGLRKADWVGKNDVYAQAYVMNGAQVSDTVDGDKPSKALVKPDENFTLPRGQYKIPFKITIPKDTPTSFYTSRCG